VLSAGSSSCSRLDSSDTAADGRAPDHSKGGHCFTSESAARTREPSTPTSRQTSRPEMAEDGRLEFAACTR
jgi:hypothetical protein